MKKQWLKNYRHSMWEVTVNNKLDKYAKLDEHAKNDQSVNPSDMLSLLKWIAKNDDQPRVELKLPRYTNIFCAILISAFHTREEEENKPLYQSLEAYAIMGMEQKLRFINQLLQSTIPPANQTPQDSLSDLTSLIENTTQSLKQNILALKPPSTDDAQPALNLANLTRLAFSFIAVKTILRHSPRSEPHHSTIPTTSSVPH